MNWMREHNKRVLDGLIPKFEETHCADVALGEAARWSKLSHIDRLVSNGVDVDCRLGERQVTPLMMAGTKPAAKKLLEHGADVNATDTEGRTALMHVFMMYFPKPQSLARVKLLLSYGTDCTLRAKDGCTARDYAIDRRSDTKSAELL